MIGKNMEVGSAAASAMRSSHYGNKTPHHQLLKKIIINSAQQD